MPDICHHKSVGMIVWKNNKLLLIERKKYPLGFAPPAGHVDKNETFEESAIRELKEEVGLETKEIKLLTKGKKENPCRRENGNWHYWKIYHIKTEGRLKRSKEETKQVGFYSKEELKFLSEKTKKYLNKKISEKEWKKSPGIEPVWIEWFEELKII